MARGWTELAARIDATLVEYDAWADQYERSAITPAECETVIPVRQPILVAECPHGGSSVTSAS